jgi:hypothetical protein
MLKIYHYHIINSEVNLMDIKGCSTISQGDITGMRPSEPGLVFWGDSGYKKESGAIENTLRAMLQLLMFILIRLFDRYRVCRHPLVKYRRIR